MTENEKLRALLAEARKIPDDVYMWHGPKSYARVAAVLERIDAALAEPVEGPLNAISRLQQQLHEAKSNADWLVQRAQRERDEARAEVERLRYALKRGECALSLVNEKWTKPAFERGAHLPSIRADLAVVSSTLRGCLDPLYDPERWRKDETQRAYKRGAEAMREAAVLCGQERALYWTETSAAEGGITTMEDRAEEARSIADDIRALPVPEDEP